MSDKKYVVPDGMIEAAKGEFLQPPNGVYHEHPVGLFRMLATLLRALEAALRWQAEHPPVLTDEQWHQISSDGKATEVTRSTIDTLLRFVFCRMYLAPEPEVNPIVCSIKNTLLGSILTMGDAAELVNCVRRCVLPEPEMPEELRDAFRRWNGLLTNEMERDIVALDEERKQTPGK